MLHVNGLNTLPIFLTLSMVLGDPADIGQSLSIAEPGFTWEFGLLSGCILTYAQFLCAAVCSALTTSMISAAKSFIQTILGFFTFGGVQFHPLNITGLPVLNVQLCDNVIIISGLVMNILGGVINTYVRQFEKRQQNAKRLSKFVENGISSPELKHKRNSKTTLISYEDDEKHRTV